MNELPAALAPPRHRRIWDRGPNSRQIGLDPQTAVLVEDLVPALAAMLDEIGTGELDDGRGVGTEPLLARAVARGAPRPAAERLLVELIRSGGLVDAAAEALQARSATAATVLVDGDGPLAIGVVIGLAAAGVTVCHRARGTVRAADLGTGLLDADVGRPRSDAATDAVRRLVPDARTGAPTARPDLVVLCDAAIPDPVRVDALLADRVRHLPVRLSDGLGVVGPLVLPGRTPCLRCVELHHGDRDPSWPLLAAQLANRIGRADSACTLATAALATAQVLRALGTDGGAPPTVAAVLELDPSTGTLVRRVTAPHAGCGCVTGRPGLTDRVGGGRRCAQPARGETIER